MPFAPIRYCSAPRLGGTCLYNCPFARPHRKRFRRTVIGKSAMVAQDFGVKLEMMSRSWSGPLRYLFSLTLPAANLVALYSDTILASASLSSVTLRLRLVVTIQPVCTTGDLCGFAVRFVFEWSHFSIRYSADTGSHFRARHVQSSTSNTVLNGYSLRSCGRTSITITVTNIPSISIFLCT